IPVMPQFAEPLERTTCAAELGVSAEIFTVLMMAGGAGVGALDELAARLLALARKHPGKLFPLGFTTTVERVMTAADLVVTKPGGLSVSECLAMGKPMLLV